MKTVGILLTISVAIFVAAVSVRVWSQEPSNSIHVVEMTAKAFEFTPSEVHVKKGERVQIKLRTLDRAHGLNLTLHPEGVSEDGNPGLVFDHPQDNGKVEKGKDRTFEFLAARAGTYDFKCSVQCSMFGKGHEHMTGKLIVDE